MADAPRVTVLLPVFDGAAYVERAVRSILAQSFRDFELLAIDDGSRDDTARILDAIDDPRMRVVHQPNMGLPATLNRGLALARGAYVARQDHDDVSLPTRLAQQVAFLDAQPAYALLGTRAEIHRDGRFQGRAHDHPLEHATLCFELLFDNPFVHSSVMMRRALIQQLGGYTTSAARQPEDFELWSRVARVARVANLPERLVVYHEVAGSISRASATPFEHRLVTLSAENLAFCLGMPEASADIRDTAALNHARFELLSARPNLLGVLAVVRRAAAHLQRGAPCAELAPYVARKQRLLTLQYLLRSARAQDLLQRYRALKARALSRP